MYRFHRVPSPIIPASRSELTRPAGSWIRDRAKLLQYVNVASPQQSATMVVHLGRCSISLTTSTTINHKIKHARTRGHTHARAGGHYFIGQLISLHHSTGSAMLAVTIICCPSRSKRFRSKYCSNYQSCFYCPLFRRWWKH